MFRFWETQEAGRIQYYHLSCIYFSRMGITKFRVISPGLKKLQMGHIKQCKKNATMFGT